MKILINDWNELLIEEFQKPYFKRLQELLVDEYRTKNIYPRKHEILAALEYTDYQSVKVVILGQDPYHGPNQAHGLSFSVKDNVKIPPSLKNIFKELKDDLGYDIPNTGNLTYWAKQGVLLLNTVLTVRSGEPNSHRNIGWEVVTDRIITLLNQRKKPVIFILWGKHAQDKVGLINKEKHFIITSPHPSPFSSNKGFFGSKPFSKANQYLMEIGEGEIDWQIPNK